jgi:phosphonate transport system permease protein
VTVSSKRRWSRPPVIKNPWVRYVLLLAIVLYLILALGTLDINWLRVQRGLERSSRLFVDFFRPDFVSRWRDIRQGITESLTMTVVSTILGIILSIPIAFGAAKNVAPLPVYLFCRGIIALSRTFQEVIIAILFVVMFGFGPFAGMLTLAFGSIGFLAKLLAEDIEDIDLRQVEATRATGASWLQVMNFGVVPQVLPRFVGLSVYRLDINFRESTIIGVVGAGGIGATLNTAFSRYDFDSASAILLIIIAIVLVTEYFSAYIRKQVQ